VLTTDDMGVSRRLLVGEGRLPSLAAKGVLFGLAIVGASLLVELAQAGAGFEAQGALGPAEGDWSGLLLWLVSGCVIAPLSEEFFFRGYAFHAFRQRYGLAVGVVASALFFSIIHLNAYGFLPILVAGVGLALVYHNTRSLVPCIVAHAVNNLIALAAMFLGFGG
jgi:membrane protease YdiL (CAAX protease family)